MSRARPTDPRSLLSPSPRSIVRTPPPLRTRRARTLYVLAAATLVLGYGALIRGDVTIAPVLLVASYVWLVPFALLAD